MVYGDFKDLNRRATADKVLGDKAFNIDKNPKYDGYQRRSAEVNLQLKMKLFLIKK